MITAKMRDTRCARCEILLFVGFCFVPRELRHLKQVKPICASGHRVSIGVRYSKNLTEQVEEFETGSVAILPWMMYQSRIFYQSHDSSKMFDQ